ncbi:MAG TPA: 6-carboxytetrahydropterin synthase QueD [Aliidongia sp.]|nr:6-carboxytetrahydropterin synthase QueD [Aliidongia sp.]
MAYDIEITKEFRFDAAHRLPQMPAGHPYTRMHGHSFRVAVTLSGTPDPTKGWITDFAEIDRVLAGLRDELDHMTLNEIPGLENPTLEIIARWIFERAAQSLPGLRLVSLYRDSIGESCTVRAAKLQ